MSRLGPGRDIAGVCSGASSSGNGLVSNSDIHVTPPPKVARFRLNPSLRFHRLKYSSAIAYRRQDSIVLGMANRGTANAFTIQRRVEAEAERSEERRVGKEGRCRWSTE